MVTSFLYLLLLERVHFVLSCSEPSSTRLRSTESLLYPESSCLTWSLTLGWLHLTSLSSQCCSLESRIGEKKGMIVSACLVSQNMKNQSSSCVAGFSSERKAKKLIQEYASAMNMALITLVCMSLNREEFEFIRNESNVDDDQMSLHARPLALHFYKCIG